MVDLNPKFQNYNGWSFSKYQLWNKCKRAYYFQYIGGYVIGPKPFDSTNLYHFKKDLTSKIFLQGQLIHNIIENQLGQHKLGRELNETGAISQYCLKLKRYQETATETITEYSNGEPFDNPFFEKIKETGIEQIQTFFNIIWPPLKDLEYIDHENRGIFKIRDIDVLLRPDYVSKTKTGLFVISDWKTGADNENYENEKQIATYALWAIYNFNIDPKEIRSELVYLSTGNSRSFSFNEKELEETRNFIFENYQKLNESYEFESFEPNPSPKNCMSCNYAKICQFKITKSSVDFSEDLLIPKKSK